MKAQLSPKDVIERVRDHFIPAPKQKIGARVVWGVAKGLVTAQIPGGALIEAGVDVVEGGVQNLLRRPSAERIMLDHTTGNTFRLRLGALDQQGGQLFDAIVRHANGGGAVVVAKNSGLLLESGWLQNTKNALVIVPVIVISFVLLFVVIIGLEVYPPPVIVLWLLSMAWVWWRLSRIAERGLEEEEANFSVISDAMLELFKGDIPAAVVSDRD